MSLNRNNQFLFKHRAWQRIFPLPFYVQWLNLVSFADIYFFPSFLCVCVYISFFSFFPSFLQWRKFREHLEASPWSLCARPENESSIMIARTTTVSPEASVESYATDRNTPFIYIYIFFLIFSFTRPKTRTTRSNDKREAGNASSMAFTVSPSFPQPVSLAR